MKAAVNHLIQSEKYWEIETKWKYCMLLKSCYIKIRIHLNINLMHKIHLLQLVHSMSDVLPWYASFHLYDKMKSIKELFIEVNNYHTFILKMMTISHEFNYFSDLRTTNPIQVYHIFIKRVYHNQGTVFSLKLTKIS